jgi:nicotinamidase-related amidase
MYRCSPQISLAPSDSMEWSRKTTANRKENSAFYATPLAELLQFLDVKTLVLTGIATDSCVLFTANDAHLRNYSVLVPADCVAAINREDGKHALGYMQRALNARVVESASIDFEAFKSGKG